MTTETLLMLAQLELKGREWRVLMVLLDKDVTGLAPFVEATGLAKPHVSNALAGLIEKHVIIKVSHGERKPATYLLPDTVIGQLPDTVIANPTVTRYGNSKNGNSKNGNSTEKSVVDSVPEALLPDTVIGSNPSLSLEDSLLKEKIQDKEKKKRSTVKDSPDLPDAYAVLTYLNEKAHHRYEMIPNSVIHILTRLRHGATVEKLKLIVDYKVEKWNLDPKMHDSLNNSTLFLDVHYSTYLEEATQWKERRDRTADPFHMDSFVPPPDLDPFKVDPADLKSGIEKSDKEKMREETDKMLDVLKVKFGY